MEIRNKSVKILQNYFEVLETGKQLFWKPLVKGCKKEYIVRYWWLEIMETECLAYFFNLSTSFYLGLPSRTMTIRRSAGKERESFFFIYLFIRCLPPIFISYSMGSMYLWKVVFDKILIAFCFFDDTVWCY